MPSLLTKFSVQTAEDAEQQIECTTIQSFAVEDCLDFF